MNPPSFSQLFTIALTKSLNNGYQDYYFLSEIAEALGNHKFIDVKKGKPPKFSKKTFNVLNVVVDICTQWMNYLKLISYTDDSKRLINNVHIQFLLAEPITLDRLKKLPNYNHFIVFYSAYYACYEFDHKSKVFHEGQYIQLEEGLNKSLYGATGDPLLNDLIHELKSRLSFNLHDYDRFASIKNATPGKLAPLQKIKIAAEIQKLVSLLQDQTPSLEEQLLQTLKSLTPTQFEKFSLYLIASIAKTPYDDIYNMISHYGQVGDGGIDGLVKIRNGFGGHDQHFIQCKRYDKKGVSGENIRAFFGAMSCQHSTHGIFITTSHFTKGAEQVLEALNSKCTIMPIDGQELVKRMLDEKIGIKEIDIPISFAVDKGFFNQFL